MSHSQARTSGTLHCAERILCVSSASRTKIRQLLYDCAFGMLQLGIFGHMLKSERQVDTSMWKKVRIKAERVVGEKVVQLVEAADVPLPDAKKVDRVVASLVHVTDHVFPNKVVKQGIIHKQIFWVDADDFVRHTGVDIPFVVTADIPGTQPGHIIENFLQDLFVDFKLCDGVLLEKVVAHILVKVAALEQIDVLTSHCGVFTTGPAHGRCIWCFPACIP